MDEYIAFHIAIKYQMEALWSESLLVLIKTAIEDLENYNPSTQNKENIKSILEQNFKLKVISEDPIEIEEI